MSAIGAYGGRPAWVDLLTPDRAGATRFYGALFGWTFQPCGTEEPGQDESSGCQQARYILALADGRPVAGIAEARPSPDGFPAPATAWTTYLASTDVDADSLRVEQTGGTVLLGPVDAANRGRLLVATDPTGAVFGLWQPRQPADPPAAVPAAGPAPGTPYWHECVTPDAPLAAAFYRRLFDADSVRLAELDVTASPHGRPGSAGHTPPVSLPADVPPRWLLYFAVDDATTAAKRAVELGAAILREPEPTGGGCLAQLRDPYGAIFVVGSGPAGPGPA